MGGVIRRSAWLIRIEDTVLVDLPLDYPGFLRLPSSTAKDLRPKSVTKICSRA